MDKCACCKIDRPITQWRGLELCDECIEFISILPSSGVGARAPIEQALSDLDEAIYTPGPYEGRMRRAANALNEMYRCGLRDAIRQTVRSGPAQKDAPEPEKE